MTLKNCETLDQCAGKWKEELTADPSMVIKGPDGSALLGRYDGAESCVGWQQSMNATRRQKCELSNDEELSDFNTTSEAMMSSFKHVVFSRLLYVQVRNDCIADHAGLDSPPTPHCSTCDQTVK